MDKTKRPSKNTLIRSRLPPKIHTGFFSTLGLATSICGLALTAGCSPAEDAGARSSDQLGVAKQYQEPLEQAWLRAEEGKAPSCAIIFGHANVAINISEDGNTDEAMQAIEACYVQATARYIAKLLEPVKAGDGNCNVLLAQGSIQRHAMRTVLKGMNVETEPLDQRLNTLIAPDVEQWCPRNAASAILQY